jgi:hypothetical protein
MLSVAPAALIAGGAALAEIPIVLLQEGQPLPGALTETVTAINNTAVNHVGGFAATVNTEGTGTLSHAWGSATDPLVGTLLRTEGTFGQYEQVSWESFFGFGNAGEVGYSPSCTDLVTGATGLDAAWLDDTAVLTELDPVAALPGQYSVFNSRVGVTGDGRPYWVGGISDVQGGSTQSRVLFLGTNAVPVLKAGDPIAGITEVVDVGSAIDFDVRFSALGTSYITPVVVDSGTSANDTVMIIDAAAIVAGGGLVREGSPVPAIIGGLPDENWANFDYVGVTEAGGYLVTGDTNAAVAVDEFVLVNGEIVLREGDVLTGAEEIEYTISGSIEGGYLNENGDWAVTWDVDGPSGNVEALIANGRIVLLEGDLVDWNGDGVIDGLDDGARITDFTGITALVLGDRDATGKGRAYFTADMVFDSVPDVIEGLVTLEIALATCASDVDGDGQVGFSDLLEVLSNWGPCVGCPSDIDGDGMVGFSDLLIVLSTWGPCA